MFLFRFVRMVPVLCMVAGSAWAVGDSAEEVARAWLRAQGLHENWNSSISTMATIGGSSFTIPRNCANSDFLRLREGAFSSAFRTMLREQIASVRMRMVGEQSVNRGTRTYSGERRFEVLRSLLRDWNELEKAPFVWRRKCVYDANGEEVAFSSIRNVENMTVLVDQTPCADERRNPTRLQPAIEGCRFAIPGHRNSLLKGACILDLASR